MYNSLVRKVYRIIRTVYEKVSNFFSKIFKALNLGSLIKFLVKKMSSILRRAFHKLGLDLEYESIVNRVKTVLRKLVAVKDDITRFCKKALAHLISLPIFLVKKFGFILMLSPTALIMMLTKNLDWFFRKSAKNPMWFLVAGGAFFLASPVLSLLKATSKLYSFVTLVAAAIPAVAASVARIAPYCI